jgi:hypothetical protein
MCSHIDKNMDSKIIRVGEEIREKGVWMGGSYKFWGLQINKPLMCK